MAAPAAPHADPGQVGGPVIESPGARARAGPGPAGSAVSAAARAPISNGIVAALTEAGGHSRSLVDTARNGPVITHRRTAARPVRMNGPARADVEVPCR